MSLTKLIKPQIKKLLVEDFADVEEGACFTVNFKSFNYYKGYAFGTFTIASEGSIRVILGDSSEFPVNVLLPLKGTDMELQYRGVSLEGYLKAAIQF